MSKQAQNVHESRNSLGDKKIANAKRKLLFQNFSAEQICSKVYGKKPWREWTGKRANRNTQVEITIVHIEDVYKIIKMISMPSNHKGLYAVWNYNNT